MPHSSAIVSINQCACDCQGKIMVSFCCRPMSQFRSGWWRQQIVQMMTRPTWNWWRRATKCLWRGTRRRSLQVIHWCWWGMTWLLQRSLNRYNQPPALWRGNERQHKCAWPGIPMACCITPMADPLYRACRYTVCGPANFVGDMAWSDANTYTSEHCPAWRNNASRARVFESWPYCCINTFMNLPSQWTCVLKAAQLLLYTTAVAVFT